MFSSHATVTFAAQKQQSDADFVAFLEKIASAGEKLQGIYAYYTVVPDGEQGAWRLEVSSHALNYYEVSELATLLFIAIYGLKSWRNLRREHHNPARDIDYREIARTVLKAKRRLETEERVGNTVRILVVQW